MQGGIRAWKGMVAHGLPEAGMAYFTPADTAEEIVGLAWALEEGSKFFYQGVAEHFSADKEAHEMFTWLVSAEKSHAQHLLETYEALAGAKPDFEKLRAKFTDSMSGTVMEGGSLLKRPLHGYKTKGFPKVWNWPLPWKSMPLISISR
jgi:hypothetical protein